MRLLVEDQAIRRVVGGGAYARGQQYAKVGMVRSHHWDPASTLLTGRVRGSGRAVYTTQVFFRDAAGGIAGTSCTCPVGSGCKHVAALLLAATQDTRGGADLDGADLDGADLNGPDLDGATTEREGPAVPVPAASPWARTLDSALSTGRRAPGRDDAPLALLVEVQDDVVPARNVRPGEWSSRLTVRPARLSDRGRWVRTGAGWREVLTGGGHGLVDRHVEVLRALHRWFPESRSHYAWGPGPAWFALDRSHGAGLWAMLEEVRRSGVPLLQATTGNPPVTILDSPAEVLLDLHTDDDAVQVTPAVLVGGERLDPARMGLIGVPQPVGVYWWSDDPPARRTVGMAGFATPLDPRAVPLLTLPSALRVPAAEATRFWSGYAPRLAAVLPLGSRDGTAEVPEAPRPTLVLTVRMGQGHAAELGWAWSYRDPDGAAAGSVPVLPPGQQVPAAAPARPGGAPAQAGDDVPWRSLPAEQSLAATVAEVVDRATADVADGGRSRLRRALLAPLRPQAWPAETAAVASHHGSPADHAPHGGRRVEGWDLVELTTRVLPALRTVPDVEVVVLGDLPDYREASQPIEIRVGTGDDGGSGGGADGPAMVVGDGAPPGTAGDGAGVVPDGAVRSDQPGGLGAPRDWFDLSIDLQVEGRAVPLPMILRALVAGEDRVLLDDGLWVRIDTPALAALRALVEEARALSDDPRGPLRVSRFQAGVWDELEALGVVVEQAGAWRSAVAQLAALAEPADDVAVPATVHAELRPYQRAGFAWLRRLAGACLGGILADDMGLGKTLQVLTFVAWQRAQAGQGRREDRSPVLVVAPTSVVGTWRAEAERFVPDLVVRTVEQTGAKRGSALAEVAAGADLVVTSYALFRIEFEAYAALGWSVLVLDEAQNVKNHQSRGYACARQLRAPVKLAITGTPLENSVMELWALLGLVAPGLFPSARRFTEHYRVPIERDHDAERLAMLRRRVRPLLLRRTKEQVAADLPPRVEQVVEVELAPRHRAVYDRYLQRERQKVLGLLADYDGNRFEIFRSLTLLRRLALDPGLVDPAHDGVPATKLDVLEQMVAEVVADGHRVLVFSQFTGVLGRVRQRLDAAGTAYAYLDGSTTRRPQVIERFRSGAAPVFLISLKAGGVGLTLTEADYVILLDPWWNPAVEAQAVDRAHRIGQSATVMVYRLVAAGTIEEKVMALKTAKARLFDSVLGGGELATTHFTAADVRALLD